MDEKFIDPISLHLAGYNIQQAQQEGYSVRPMTFEESWDTNKEVIGNSMDIRQYAELYKQIYGGLTKNVKDSYGQKYTTTPKADDLKTIGTKDFNWVNPELLGIETNDESEIWKSSSAHTDIGGYFNREGTWEQTLTDEQIAESKEYYLVQGPFKLEKRPMSDYQNMNHNGSPFRYDKNGNQKMLVLDQSSKTWVEKDATEVVAGTALRSMYGPQKYESGVGENIVSNSWNTVIDGIYGTTGTISETLGTIGNWFTGSSDRNSWQDWGASMQNYANISKSKISQAVQEEGMFGSWRAGLGTAANVLTQVGMQAFIGLLTGGLGNVIGGGTKLAKVVQGAPWLFGSAYGMQAMNEEAKAAGLDDDSRAVMSLLAGGAVYASERGLKALGGAGLVDMFDNPQTARAVNTAFRNRARQIAQEVREESMKGLDNAAMQKMYKSKIEKLVKGTYMDMGVDLAEKKTRGNLVKNLTKGIAGWQYSDKPKSFIARMKAGVAAGAEEGTEEIAEGLLLGTAKMIYNEGFADPNAEPGKGKFQNAGWNISMGEFFAGMIGGFPMGALRGAHKKVNLKDYGVANLAMTMDESQGEKFLLNLHAQGALGNPLLTPDEQLYQSLPEDQRKKAKTMNDVNYEMLRQQLRLAHQLKKQTGIADPEKLDRLMDGDMNLAKDAMVSMLKVKRLETQKAELEKQLESGEEGFDRSNIEQQLKEVDADLLQARQFAEETLNGTTLKKYEALMAVRATQTRIEILRQTLDGNTENLDEMFNEAMTNLEKDDDWRNRDKAYAQVQRIKEHSRIRKEEYAKMKEGKARSKELNEILKNAGLDRIDELKDTEVNALIDAVDAIFTDEGAAPLLSQHRSQLDNISTNLFKRKDSLKSEMVKETDTYAQVLEQKVNQQKARRKIEDGELPSNVMQQLEKEAVEEAFMEIDEEADTIGTPESIDFVEKYKEQTATIDNRLDNVESIKERMYNDEQRTMTTLTGDSFEIQGKMVGGFEEISNEPKYAEAMDYFTISDDGTQTPIDKKEYEAAQARAKTEELVFENKGTQYLSVPKQTRQGQKKLEIPIPTVDENGNIVSDTTEVDAYDLSPQGEAMLNLVSFKEQLQSINASFTGEPTPKQAEDILAIKKAILNEIETIILAKNLMIDQSIPEEVRDYFGVVDANEQTLRDLTAVQKALEKQYQLAAVLEGKMKESANLRETLLKQFEKNHIKQMALLHNQLSDRMANSKIIVGGVIMERPDAFEKLDEVDEAAVYRAMQYWHYYFQNNMNSETVKSFAEFWHEVVMQKVIDEDGNFLNEFKPGTFKYGMTNQMSANEQGMFINDIDPFLDFDTFENPGLENEYRQLAYYQLMNFILHVDPEVMVSTLKQIVNPENGFPGAHTAEQLYVLQGGITHLHENQMLLKARNNKNEKYIIDHHDLKTIMKVGAIPGQEGKTYVSLYSFTPEQKRKGEWTGSHIRDNFFFIPGSGGVGKTSFIVRTLSEYARLNAQNNGQPVVLVAPNQSQLNGLIKAAKEAGVEYEALTTTDFIEKQHEYRNALVFIDEVSLMSDEQRGAIYFNGNLSKFDARGKIPIAKRADGSEAEVIDDSNTVFVLGDEYQAPYEPGSSFPKMSKFMQHSINLTQVKRTSLVDIYDIQNLFRNEIAKKGYGGMPSLTKKFQYYHGPEGKYGVRPINKEDDFIKEAMRVNDVEDAYVIVLNNADANKLANAGINSDKIKIMTEFDKSPQGMTIGEAYVYVPTHRITNKKEEVSKSYVKQSDFNRYMAMAVGRGKNYVAVYTSNGKIPNVGAEPVRTYAELDRFPQNPEKDQQEKEALHKRFVDLSSALQGSTPKEKTVKQGHKITHSKGSGTRKTDNTNGKNEERTVKEETEIEDTGIDPVPTDTRELAYEQISKVAAIDPVYKVGNEVPVKLSDKSAKMVKISSVQIVSRDDFMSTGNFITTVEGVDADGVIYTLQLQHDGDAYKRIGVMTEYPDGEQNTSEIQEEDVTYQESDGGGQTLDPRVRFVNIVDENGKVIKNRIDSVTVEGHVLQVGASYPVKHRDKIGTITITAIYQLDDGTFKVKLSNGRIITADRFTSTIESNGLPQSDVAKSDMAILTDLAVNEHIYFTNRYVPAFDQEASYEENARQLAENLQAALQSGKKIGFAVIVQRGGSPVQSAEQDTHTIPDYTYRLEYEGKLVAIMPIYKDSQRGSDKTLAVRAEESLGDSNEATVHTGTIDRTEAIQGDSFFNKSMKGKKIPAIQVVQLMQAIFPKFKIGDSPHQIDQTNAQGDPVVRTVMTFEPLLGMPPVQLSLNSIRLIENPSRAKEYLQDLISELEQSNADETLRSIIPNIIQFFDYNGSQIYSDLRNGVKYAKELLEAGLIMEDNNRKKGKGMKIVGGLEQPNAFANNIRAAINIILKDSNLEDSNNRLRFSPVYIDGKMNIQDFTTASPVFPGMPAMRVPMPKQVFYGEGPVNNGKGGLAKSAAESLGREDYNVRAVDAMARLQELLGNKTSLVFDPNLMANEGAHGMLTKLGNILLNYNDGWVNEGVIDHEVAHFVAEFLTPESQRRALYTEVAQRQNMINFDYDNIKQRRQAAEYFAEYAERFASDRRNLKGISKLLKQFLDAVKYFFDKIGIIRNITHRYLYDIYIQKRYREDMTMSEGLYQEQLPYDELYMRATSYVDFNKVSKHFGDRNVAIRASDTMASYLAYQVTAPVVSNQKFREDNINFTDIINRIEYTMRKHVMFETDKHGNILKYQEGPFKGQPILRTQDIDGTQVPMQIEVMGQLVDLFHYENDVEDEQNIVHKGPQLMYFDPLEKIYKLVPKNRHGIMFSKTWERKKIRKLMKEAMRNFMIPTKKEDIFGPVMTPAFPFDDINRADLINPATDNLWPLIYASSTLDDNVLSGMLNRYFPNIEIKDILQGKRHNIQLSEVLDRMIKQQDSVARAETNMINPLDRMSDLMKFLIMTTPKYYYDGKRWVPTQAKVNIYVAQDVLTDLPMSQQSIEGSLIDNIADYIQSEFTKMESIERTEDQLMSNERYAVLRSIYEQYFSPSSFSHRRILQMQEQLVTEEITEEQAYAIYLSAYSQQQQMGWIDKTEVSLDQEQFINGLSKRAKASADVLQALTTHFGSVSRDAYTKAYVYGTEENARFAIRGIDNNSVEETKLELEHHIMGKLEESDGSISPAYRALFAFDSDMPLAPDGSGRLARTVLKNNGIYYNDAVSGQEYKIIAIDDNNNLAPVQLPVELNKETMVRTIFNELFGKNDFAPWTIKQFAYESTDPKNPGWEKFHEIIGPIALSMYTYAAQNYVDPKNYSTKSPHLDKYLLVLNNTGNSQDYGRLSEHSLNNMRFGSEEGGVRSLLDTEEESELMFHPNGFYEELREIAKAMAGTKPTFAYTVKDKRIYLNTVQDMIGYRLNDGGINQMKLYQNDDTTLNANDRLGIIHNPFYGDTVETEIGAFYPNNQGFVKSAQFIGGVRQGNKGIELDNLTGRDNFDLAMAMFMKDQNATPTSWRRSAQPIMMFNQGDRTRQRVMTYNWEVNGYKGTANRGYTNGLMTMDKDGNLKIDSHNVMHHILNMYNIVENAQVHSLNRWVDFFTDQTGIFIDQDDKIDFTDANWRDKRDQTLDKIKKVMKEGFTFSIINGKTVQAFDGYGMTAGIDYIILEGSEVYLGHDTTMNSDLFIPGVGRKANAVSIFNWHKYNKGYKVKVSDGNVYIRIQDLIRGQDIKGDIRLSYNDSKGVEQTVKVDEAFKRKMLFNLFAQDLQETNRVAKKFGYKLYKTDMPKGVKLDVLDKVKGSKPGIKINKNTYYEPWAAYVMAETITNGYFQYAFEGSYAQELDNNISADKTSIKFGTNANKRLMQHSSTMVNPTTGGYYGMDIKGKTVILSEIMMPAAIYGHRSLQEMHSVFDGQAWENPLQSYMRWVATGRAYSSVNKNGAIKSQTINYNRLTGQSNKYKHAKAIFSGQSMDLMPEERMLFEISLNPQAKSYVNTPFLQDQIKDLRNIPVDSLWQRFLIYEESSKYHRAITGMETFISIDGGLESYIAKVFDAKGDDLMRIVNSVKEAKKHKPGYVYYYELTNLLRQGQDERFIKPPSKETDFEWAIEQLADFYYLQRAQGNPMPFIGQFEQGSAAVKQRAQPQSIPIALTFGGQSQDIRALQHLATEQNAPTDLISAYNLWLNEEGDMPIEMYTIDHDNSIEGIQLNPNRNVGDSSESPMIQLMSIVLAAHEQHRNGQAREMINLLSNIIEKALDKFDLGQKQIAERAKRDKQLANQLSKRENAVIEQYVKEQIKKAMSSSDDGSMLTVILNDPEIGLNVSEGLQERVYQYLASFFRKEAVKRKQEAMRLLQLGGNNIHLYRFQKENGEVETFNFKDAVIYARKILGISIDAENANASLLAAGFQVDSLRNTTIKQGVEASDAQLNTMAAIKANPNLNDFQKQAQITKFMIEQGLAVVERGEAVMPASKFEKYGIPKSMRMNQLFRLYERTDDGYADINLRTDNRELLKETIRQYIDRNLIYEVRMHRGKLYPTVKYSSNIEYGDHPYFDTLFYDSINELLNNQTKSMKELLTKAENLLAGKNNMDEYFNGSMPNDKYYEEIQPEVQMLYSEAIEDTVNQLITKMTDGLIATQIAARQGLGVRTPSGPGSGFMVEVVQFINDNSSVGYVNTIKNLIDGSDQDADQFTFYYKSDTLDERGYTGDEYAQAMESMDEQQRVDEELNVLNNQLVDLLFDYYNNPQNNHITGSPINMNALKWVAAKNEQDIFPNGDFAHNFGHSIIYRRTSYDGKVVGPFAQSQKVQTMLFSAGQINGDPQNLYNYDLFPFRFDAESYKNIPGRVEGLTNGATDNIKLFVVGNMNVSFVNADTVAAALSAPQELLDIVRSYPERFGIDSNDLETLNDEERVLYSFFQGEAHRDLFNYINRQKNFRTQGYAKSFYAQAHEYYSKIDANKKENTKAFDNAQRDILGAQQKIEEVAQKIGIKELNLENLYNRYGRNFGKVLMGMARKFIKGIHVEAQAVIEAELKGELSRAGYDQLVDEIDSVLEGIYKTEEVYEIYEHYTNETGEKVEKALERSATATEDFVELIQAVRRFQDSQQKVQALANKIDPIYRQQLFLLTKYAMLGEWMRGAIRISDINQFKPTSTYESQRFIENLEFMTGRSMNELIRLFDEYQELKEDQKNITPLGFLEQRSNLSVEQISNRAFDMRKHAMARKENRHINDTVNYKKQYINYREQFHSIGNITAVLLARPDLMQSIKALAKLENAKEQLFVVHNNDFTEVKDTMLEEIGFDSFTERQQRSYHTEANAFLTGLFLGESQDIQEKFTDALTAMGYFETPLVGQDGIARIPRLNSGESRKNFVQQFPIFFEKQLLKELYADNFSDPTTELISRLNVISKGTMQYINIRTKRQMTPDEEERLREGFRGLPTHVRDLLAIYQIAKSGFSQKGFLGKILPVEYYQMYSQFLEKDNLLGQESYKTKTMNDFKWRLLSNPSKGFARRMDTIKTLEGGKFVYKYAAPMTAYGPAKFSFKPIRIEWRGKFGRQETLALAKLNEDTVVRPIRTTGSSSANMTRAKEILDIEAVEIAANTIGQVGDATMKLDGLTLGAYLYYFLKGNINQVEEPTVEKLNARYARETRGKIELLQVDEQTETYADALQRVSDKWYKEIAQALRREYTESEFNELVAETKGKAIGASDISNQQAMPYVLSDIFNFVGKSDNPYNQLFKIKGKIEDETTQLESNVSLYRNRLTDLGMTYDRFANQSHITEMRVGQHDTLLNNIFGKDINKYSAARQNMQREFAGYIVKSWYESDLSFLPDPQQAKYGGLFNSKEDMINTLRNGLDMWVEYNIGYDVSLKHQQLLHKMSVDGKAKVIKNHSLYSNKIKRTHIHPYQIGDVIRFTDGTEGVVINVGDAQVFEGKTMGYKSFQYVLNPNYSPTQNIMRAQTTLENRLNDNNARRVLVTMTRKIAQALPNVHYEMITNEQAALMGELEAKSFYKNGKVYINLDKADEGVVVHEFAHPFTLALEEHNPQLWNRLAMLVENDQEVMETVKKNYPELTDRLSILREAIPTYLQYRFYARKRWEMGEESRQTIDDYFAWINTRLLEGLENTDTKLNDVDWQNASLNDIADAILNDMMGNKPITWVQSAMMPYTMKAKSTSKFKNLSLSNINRLFQVKADYTEEAELRAAAINRVNAGQGKMYQGLTGTYDLRYNAKTFLDNDGNFLKQKYENRVQEVIEKEYQFYTGANEKILNYFDLLKEYSPLAAAMNTIYSGWKQKYKIDDSTNAEVQELEYRLELFNSHIGFDPNTDEALSIENAAKRLNITLPTNIDSNAFVIIHNIGQPSQSISVITSTTANLANHGVGEMQVLGDAFADKDLLSKKERRRFREIPLSNTNQDLQAVQNAVVAMAFAREGIKVKKVGSVRITQERYRTYFKEMRDIIVPMKKLFSVKLVQQALERDLFELVTDETLMNPNTYQRDTFEVLGEYIDTVLAQENEEITVKRMQEMKDLLAHVQEDHLQMKRTALARAVKARLNYLRIEVLGNNEELLETNDEYQMLAEQYMLLTSYDDINAKKVTPISFDEKWIDTADRWHGQVRTWVFDTLDKNMRQAKEELLPFQAEINDWTKTLNKQNPHLSLVKDDTHKLFKNLFKKRTVLDKNGNSHEISIHEIHHDINDPETAKALANKMLTETELEFGKWLADNMYEEFVRYIMDVERSSIANSFDISIEELRTRAENAVSYKYKKGQIPVFVRTFGAALSEGNLSEALKLFTETAGRWYGGNLYNEYEQSGRDFQTEKFKQLLSPFWSQFTNSSNGGVDANGNTFFVGSDQRMAMLGLGRDANGNIILLNDQKQKQLSFNLQNAGLFTMAASKRSRYLKEGVAAINIALDILRGEQARKGIKTDDIISQLENYVNRQVYGNLPQHGKFQVLGAAINIDNMLDASGKLIHMIHLAVNPLLGAKNAASAAIKMLINATVNSMSGSDMFGINDITKAVQEVINNPKKVEMLNRKYQIVDVSERDIINHFTKNISKKNITETDYQMMFHYYGDHYTKLIGAIAQMIKEGTYNAHNENGNYDQTLDERFYENGQLTEKGKLLLNDVKKTQIREGYHSVGIDQKMTHAYSQRDENRLKLISERYVGEMSDPQYKNMASSYGLARAVMSLKNYMYNVKQYWWKNRAAETQLGKREVVFDPEKGEKVVWEPKMTEGLLNTILYMGDQIRKGEKVKLDKWQKRNLVSMGTYMLVIAGMYLLVDLMTDGFDDDDDKRTKKVERKFFGYRLMDQLYGGYQTTADAKNTPYYQQVLRYIIAGGVNEQLIYMNPYQVIKEWSNNPNPYIWQIENIVNSLYGTLALPYKVSQEGVPVAVGKWSYALSRNIPYGSNYRLIMNTIDGLYDDYQQTITRQ